MSMTTKRVTAVLATLVVLAGVLTFWLSQRSGPDDVVPAVGDDGSYTVGTIPEAGDGPVKAAAEAMPVALSYDFRSLDDSLAQATALMTDGFADDFKATFTKTVVAMAGDKKAITKALVRGAGLIDQDGDHASCLVYVDQVLVSGEAKDPTQPVKVTQNRVRVSLTRVDGDWKIAGIEPF